MWGYYTLLDENFVPANCGMKIIPPTDLQKCQKFFDGIGRSQFHVFKTENEALVDCIAVVVIHHSGKTLEKTDHWNYHPSRKELSHTHTNHINKEVTFAELHEHIKQGYTDTFKSLLKLYQR